MKRLTYQFSNVSEVWILDPAALRPIRISVGGAEAEICPPVSDNAMVPFAKSLDGQSISTTVGLIRVTVPLSDGDPAPEWGALYESVRQCLLWVRVATRQYWVGILPSHQSNSPTALVLTEADEQERSITGLGGIRAGIRWVPLARETWEAIEIALRNGWWPSAPEQFLLDSSLHLAEGNFLQSIAGMGIACEVELNSLLEELLARLGQPVLTELYNVNRPRFHWKLKKLPQLLGASAFSQDNSDRVKALEEMYDRRGQVVHRGHAAMNGSEIARFWFAAEEFFEWSRKERIRFGIGPDLRAMYQSLEQGKKKFSFVFGAD